MHCKRVANTSVLRRKSDANTYRLTPQTRSKDIAKASVLRRKSAHKHIRLMPQKYTKEHHKCTANVSQTRPFFAEKAPQTHPFNAANVHERRLFNKQKWPSPNCTINTKFIFLHRKHATTEILLVFAPQMQRNRVCANTCVLCRKSAANTSVYATKAPVLRRKSTYAIGTGDLNVGCWCDRPFGR